MHARCSQYATLELLEIFAMSDEERRQQEALLAEYSELREEIRTYLQRQEQNKNFAFLLAIGVVSLESFPVDLQHWVFFIVALLVTFLWFDEIRRLEAVFRYAAYIQEFIEPHVPGLRWETLGGKHQIQTRWVWRAIANMEFPVLVVGLAAYGSSRLYGEHARFALTSFAIAIFLVVCLVLRSIHVSRHGRAEAVEQWKRIARSENVCEPSGTKRDELGTMSENRGPQK